MPFALRFLDGVLEHDRIDLAENCEIRLRYMQRNHAEHMPVYCQCNETNGIFPKLAVVLKDQVYFLRRYKGTDTEHHPDCHYGREIKSCCAGQGHIPGVVEGEEGGMRLRLGSDVFTIEQERVEAEAEVAPVMTEEHRPPARGGVSRGQITLQGIFQLLLEKAQLTDWQPRFLGKRTEGVLVRRMREVARLSTYRRGRSLADVIVWPDEEVDRATLLERFERSPMKGEGGERELIFFGRLKTAQLSGTGKTMRVELAQYRDANFLCYVDIWAKLAKQRRIALAGLNDEKHSGPVWVMMTVRRVLIGKSQVPLLFVQSLAALRFSEQLIPCESGHEVEFADYLVREGRSFAKPLRYQETDVMRPDFILSDVENETYCEVWGMDRPDYVAHREEKKAEYDRLGIKLIEWFVTKDASLPVLPPKRP